MKTPTALAMPPGLPGQSRHVWDEATYETVAWCGPALGSEVL